MCVWGGVGGWRNKFLISPYLLYRSDLFFQMKTDWRHKHRQAHATWMLLNGLVLAGWCEVGMIHRAEVMCCAVLWQGSHCATSSGDASLPKKCIKTSTKQRLEVPLHLVLKTAFSKARSVNFSFSVKDPRKLWCNEHAPQYSSYTLSTKSAHLSVKTGENTSGYTAKKWLASKENRAQDLEMI